MMEFKKT